MIRPWYYHLLVIASLTSFIFGVVPFAIVGVVSFFSKDAAVKLAWWMHPQYTLLLWVAGLSLIIAACCYVRIVVRARNARRGIRNLELF